MEDKENMQLNEYVKTKSHILNDSIMSLMESRSKRFMPQWVAAISEAIVLYIDEEIIKLKQGLINADAGSYSDSIECNIKKIHINNDR